MLNLGKRCCSDRPSASSWSRLRRSPTTPPMRKISSSSRWLVSPSSALRAAIGSVSCRGRVPPAPSSPMNAGVTWMRATAPPRSALRASSAPGSISSAWTSLAGIADLDEQVQASAGVGELVEREANLGTVHQR